MTYTDIISYLDDLDAQKQKLVEILNKKGLTAENTETFNTLIPKVNDITEPGFPAELVNKINSCGYNANAEYQYAADNLSSQFEGADYYMQHLPDTADDNVWNTFTLDFLKHTNNLKYIPAVKVPHRPLSRANLLGYSQYEEGVYYGITPISIAEDAIFDVSSINGNSLFSGFSRMIRVPKCVNNAKVTSVEHMFEYCSALQELPMLDTSTVTSFYQFCYAWDMKAKNKFITEIPAYDCGGVTGSTDYYGNSHQFYCSFELPNVTKIHLKNIKASIRLTTLAKLDTSALHELVTNLVDVGSSRVLTLHPEALARLAPEDLELANSKGWTIN